MGYLGALDKGFERADIPLEDALIAQKAVLDMIKPRWRTVKAFRSWLEGEADGSGIPKLAGLSADRLRDFDDLVALHPPAEQDWLTRVRFPELIDPCWILLTSPKFVRRYFRVLLVVSVTIVASHLSFD